MKNTLLDIIQSFEHPMDLDDQEVREVLDSIDDLTYRQIKNAIEALLDKYKSIQRGYEIRGGILSKKIEKLIQELEKKGEKLSPDSIETMKKLLEEEKYVVHKNASAIAIDMDELPQKLRDKLQAEKNRTGTVTYEKKKGMVLDALKKWAGEE